MGYKHELILKYLSNKLNDEELHQLNFLLQEDEDFQKEFKRYIQDNYLIDLSNLNEDKQATLNRIEKNSLFQEPGKLKLFQLWQKYAAAIILICATSYGIWRFNGKSPTPPSSVIVLKMDDGTTRLLNENEDIVISDSRGNDIVKVERNVLNYTSNAKPVSSKVTYNELIVPDGKRFHIRLADGTLVYVNSGTHFRYPVSFSNTDTREVFLNGEGYFEVTKNRHKPFIVKTQRGHIEVLGTHFNILAYEEDDYFKTTLAEGSVKVGLNSSPETVRLQPGQAALWQNGTNSLNVARVNIDNDIVWIHNRLMFIDESFSKIRKKIERSYGVVINNQNRELNDICFNGDFNIETETIEDVLNAFSVTGYFKYTIKNNVVTIK
jgi:transmembrane sensor